MSDKRRETLSDFCLLHVPDSARLSNFERLTLIGGLELEKSLKWLVRKLTGFSYDERLGDISVEHILSANNYYQQLLDPEKPESFFKEVSAVPEVSKIKIHGLGDGDIFDISFESQYHAQHVDFIDELHAYTENLKVHARMWKHHRPGTATLIALHGWTMGDQRINSLAFQPGYFYSLGFDVVLFELPFHGRRKPKETSQDVSGELFPSAHTVRTNEALGQVISDLRHMRLWLEEEGSVHIGCMGMSLGGYVASLWAGLDALNFCIPIVPLVSMGDMAWDVLGNHEEINRFVSEGLNRQLLRDIYHMHSPLTYNLKTDKENCLIIGGIGDKIIPAYQPELLWNHWNRPNIHWLQDGHLTQFQKKGVFQKINTFLARLGYVI